jgi:hypothetical protein
LSLSAPARSAPRAGADANADAQPAAAVDLGSLLTELRAIRSVLEAGARREREREREPARFAPDLSAPVMPRSTYRMGG